MTAPIGTIAIHESKAGSQPKAGDCSSDLERTSPDLRLKLAKAIQHQGTSALRIDSKNDPAGWTTVEQAVEADESFCISVQPDVLVLDVDKPESQPLLYQLCRLLMEEEHQPVVLKSGGEGRHHLFCRVDDPAFLAELRGRAREGGIDPRDRDGDRIRPPLTRHRSGSVPQLLIPNTAEEALIALENSESQPYSAKSGEDVRLTQRTWNRLRWGDDQANQSDYVWSIVMGAVAVGYDRTKLFNLLRNPENRGGLGLQTRIQKGGEVRGQRWFDSIWARAIEKAEESPTFQSRNDVIVGLMEIQQELARYEWPSTEVKLPSKQEPQSVSGRTIRKLISYIIELCLEMGTITPYLPERVIQENTGMDRKTSRKARLLFKTLDGSNLRMPTPGRWGIPTGSSLTMHV